MENFLLNFVPVSAITVVSALYKCVESDGWTGDRERMIQKFISISENALRKVPNFDNERLERLRSFGSGESLKQRCNGSIHSSEWANVRCGSNTTSRMAVASFLTILWVGGAFDDLCSLMEVNALAIDVVDWYEEANENIRSLKCDIGQ
ncbi:19240_t:CDS:2, partial [Entrophospora sp. SA101]